MDKIKKRGGHSHEKHGKRKAVSPEEFDGFRPGDLVRISKEGGIPSGCPELVDATTSEDGEHRDVGYICVYYEKDDCYVTFLRLTGQPEADQEYTALVKLSALRVIDRF